MEGHPLPMMLRVDDGMRALMHAVGARAGRERSLRALQQDTGTQHLPAARWQQALRNCNTPEEWIALQQTVIQADSE